MKYVFGYNLGGKNMAENTAAIDISYPRSEEKTQIDYSHHALALEHMRAKLGELAETNEKSEIRVKQWLDGLDNIGNNDRRDSPLFNGHIQDI